MFTTRREILTARSLALGLHRATMRSAHLQPWCEIARAVIPGQGTTHDIRPIAGERVGGTPFYFAHTITLPSLMLALQHCDRSTGGVAKRAATRAANLSASLCSAARTAGCFAERDELVPIRGARDALHIAFVRSTQAHALIQVDAGLAALHPGMP